MQHLITAYLFKNKKCPLPSVGALHIAEGNATSFFGEVKIAAPMPAIHFSTTEIPAAHFIKYIALQKNISVDDAALKLNEFCKPLQFMEADKEVALGDAGKFFTAADGILQFAPIEIPTGFLPPVTAQRIIHPNHSHAMLVGDTQTTNTEMSGYFSEEQILPKKRWWLWALLLMVLAALLIIIYYNDKKHNAAYGNAQSYTLSE